MRICQMFYKELNKKLKNYPLSIIHTNTIKKNDTKNSKKSNLISIFINHISYLSLFILLLNYCLTYYICYDYYLIFS